MREPDMVAAGGGGDGGGGDMAAEAGKLRARSLQGSCGCGGGGGRRVAPATGDDEAAAEVEKAMINGDVYIGEFSSNAPHGDGKYLWNDGCMYEGEWRRGKAAGKGKFSWPSGATYEGEFRSGRMEGFGVFTGHDGGTYRGSWSGDRKHGFGRKCYANGDCYEGFWRRNLQEGQGRYLWRNGNEYVGDWKGGSISGRGVLVWSNGNRYDGHWDGGVPKGSGVFTWTDGSCYVGTWGKDPRSLNGTFYPAAMSPETTMAPAKRSSSSVDAVERGSSAADQKGFPRICIWESDGDAGDITCDIIDTLEASLLGGGGGGGAPASMGRSLFRLGVSGEAKKPGQAISKGHKNYDLMLNLQLGISCSVGKCASMETRELRPGDFDPNEKFWTRFPPEGSKTTPPHQSPDFRWKDYCPMVFRHLRKLFDVDPADYMLAICGNGALRELSSPGKSGSSFYLTHDDLFMIKTVKKSEVKVLIKMLSSYYQHVCKYPNTLVTKFYGVHCVKPVGGQKVRFIVMGNLFCSDYPIHRRFDLKGSSHGRTTDKAEWEIDETTTFKDLDLDFVFRLHKSWFEELSWQIEVDCEFLEAEGIMDYSFLVGVHFRDVVSMSKLDLSQGPDAKMDPFHDWLLEPTAEPHRKHPARLGSNMPARAVHMWRGDLSRHLSGVGGPQPQPPAAHRGQVYEVTLFFGIIDVLQDYDISKKLEHAYKSLQVDPLSISAVDPKLYSRRFRDFLNGIFVEDR